MDRLRDVLAWRKDWTGTYDRRAIRARRAYLRSLDPSQIPVIAAHARAVREGRLQLAHELARPLYDELHMVSDAFVTSNPLDLVDLADESGSDRLTVRRRFEALCVHDLAVAVHELERIDPVGRVEDDLKSMIALMRRRLFRRGDHDLDIFTYHDPGDMLRVKEVSYDAPGTFPGLEQRKHNSPCRIMKDGRMFRFDVRPKDPFRTVTKMIRQVFVPKPNQDPYLVRDRCGLTLVVRGVEDARAISDQLAWFLIASGATVNDDGDNLTVDTRAPADTANARSSSKYRKKQLAVLWHGRWYEFQIVTFAGYYSAKYALDEENHALYKMRQGVKDLLPLFFPGSIYLEEGSWDVPALHAMLYERQIENLGWFQKRHHVRNGN